MRTAFMRALLEIAEHDERVWLVNGDLGYSVLEPFAERFPERYLNAGVAEQNMTGLAAGLALSGNTVFTYSIANFPTLRCLEQIRNDVCYHGAAVVVVSVGGGLAYGAQGYTHHGVEDLGMLRLLPDCTVVAPGDPVEAMLAARELAKRRMPAYLRLGKAGERVIHESAPDFELGRAIEIFGGDDVAILTIGGTLPIAYDAATALRARGVSVRLLSVHTLAPLDIEAVLASAMTGALVVVEEHGPGALATAVAEILVEHGVSTRFRRVGLPRSAMRVAGSQEYLRAGAGVSTEAIVEAVDGLISDRLAR